jgi:hypothetical protein
VNVFCRICGAPGAACGDSHQTLPLLTSAAFFKGATPMNDKQDPQPTQLPTQPTQPGQSGQSGEQGEQGKFDKQRDDSQQRAERQQARSQDRLDRHQQRSDERVAKWEEKQQEPEELKEYHYYVGYTEVTAMLTEEMADQLDAVPIDEDLEEPTGGKASNNEANRMATRNRPADDAGVVSDDDPDGKTATGKARNARNKRAGGS